jgi:hypothetical protein
LFIALSLATRLSSTGKNILDEVDVMAIDRHDIHLLSKVLPSGG